MGWFSNVFRKSDRLLVAPKLPDVLPAIDHEPIIKSYGSPRQLRNVLAGNFVGNQVFNHQEEALHFEGYAYVAGSAIANQVSVATVTAYFDGSNQSSNISKRKSLKARHGSRWKSNYGLDSDEAEMLASNHELMELLAKPSPYEPGGLFRYRQALQILLTGGAYIWNVPNVFDRTCQRYVIPTTSITPVYPNAMLPEGGYRIQPQCMRWIPLGEDWNIDGKTASGFVEGSIGLAPYIGMVISSHYIQKVGTPHPVWLDDFYSKMSAGAQWIDASRAIDIARAKCIQKGIQKNIIVELPEGTEDIGQDEMNRIQAAWDKKFAGPDNSGGALVTTSGTKVTPASSTPKDMAYSEGFKDNKDAIMALFGTPDIAVGSQTAGTMGANVAAQRQWKYTALDPLCNLLAESDTFHLAPQFGKGITIELEAQAIHDETETNARCTILVTGRSITKDELRSEMGLEPMEDEEEGKKLAGPDPAEQPQNKGMIGGGTGGYGNPMTGASNAEQATKIADPTEPESPYVQDPLNKSLQAAIEGMKSADQEWIEEKVRRGIESVLKARDPMKPRKFSSTQINLPPELADQVIALGNEIPDDALADDGREDQPHVTALYGLHTNNPKIVQNAIAGFGPINITLGETSYFECDHYDVVKIDVISSQIHQLHEVLADACEHTSTHPNYVPHVTIAYVASGLGKLYARRIGMHGSFTADELYFSGQNGNKQTLSLKSQSKSFDEAKHPRNEGGEFSEGNSGSENQSEKKPSDRMRESDQKHKDSGHELMSAKDIEKLIGKKKLNITTAAKELEKRGITMHGIGPMGSGFSAQYWVSKQKSLGMETASGSDGGFTVKADGSDTYGLCPVCGSAIVSVERRPDGNAQCLKGHSFPRKNAVTYVSDIKSFDESKHPRGHEGNSGQFSSMNQDQSISSNGEATQAVKEWSSSKFKNEEHAKAFCKWFGDSSSDINKSILAIEQSEESTPKPIGIEIDEVPDVPVKDVAESELKSYNESESRDSDGKWTSGGNASSSTESSVIGHGSNGEVHLIGNEVHKPFNKNEAEAYKELQGVRGVSPHRVESGKIVTPYYSKVISVDDIPEKQRKNCASLLKKGLPDIINAISAMSSAGIDYNDQLQVGLDKNRNANVIDFSMATKVNPDEATRNNSAMLGNYLKQFGLERDGDAIHRSGTILDYVNDPDTREFDSDSQDAKDASKIASQLDGKKATNVYYCFNARTIPGVAQTENDKTAKYIVTGYPLSDEFMSQWEIKPAIHFNQRNSTENKSRLKSYWVTLKPHGGDSKGVPVELDSGGNILKGPSDFEGKHISELSSEHKEAKKLIPHAHEFLLNQHEAWENAKRNARKTTGLTAGDIARIENSYRDHSTVDGFDTTSRDAAMENPDLGLDPHDDETPARVWQIIREGARKKPTKNSREVLDLAKEWSRGPRHKVSTDVGSSTGDDW